MPTSAPSTSTLPGVTPAQASFVSERLGPVELLEDMSWGGFDSTVLRVRVPVLRSTGKNASSPGGAEGVGVSGTTGVAPGDASQVIIKVCGEGEGSGRHHFRREIAAYRNGAVDPLIAARRAARLLHADVDLGVMILELLPGSLVFGSEYQLDVDTHRQAGELLRLIHANPSTDTEYDAKATRRALDWLDGPHRIPEPDASAARRILEDRAANPRDVEVVHSHGDYHPRNWMRDGDAVYVIDWGRYDRRPAYTDFVRLACQEWRDRPELGAAFAQGYGEDLRDSNEWKIEYLRQAVGTACWAPTIGDDAFEAQGRRMVREALALLRHSVLN